MKTSYYIEVLKEKVKQEIQSEVISVRTTNNLSEKIFERTQKKISSSTLQRLYELVAIKTFPSKNTLNVLSEFVGFNNWEHFCKNEDEPHLSLKENIVPDAMALKLFEISLKNHNFKTVLEYLKLLPINISLGDTQKKISEIFGEVFRKDREARNILLPKLAKMPEGRLYFYETFVDIDFLSVYYADSLSEYEEYINPKEKIKSKRDFIFVNTIKFLNYLKTNQKKENSSRRISANKAFRPKRGMFRKHSRCLSYCEISFFIFSISVSVKQS